ncbi:hypothetical protein [Sphaerisporangium sp. NPDC051011]|uniref:hypothetical protein n=1 Tax=Sphaerisporangium sp. NPDC051011 TaxID=3155792 RepID=UPI0033C27EED
MFSEASVIAEDVVRAVKERHLAVVEDILAASAGELDLLGDALSARDAATILVDALAGITQEKEPPAVLRTRLRQLVDLTVRGLSSAPPRVPGV